MALLSYRSIISDSALCIAVEPHDKDEVKGPIGKFIHKFNVWFTTLSKYVKNVEKCIRHAKSQWPFYWLWLFYWAGS